MAADGHDYLLECKQATSGSTGGRGLVLLGEADRSDCGTGGLLLQLVYCRNGFGRAKAAKLHIRTNGTIEYKLFQCGTVARMEGLAVLKRLVHLILVETASGSFPLHQVLRKTRKRRHCDGYVRRCRHGERRRRAESLVDLGSWSEVRGENGRGWVEGWEKVKRRDDMKWEKYKSVTFTTDPSTTKASIHTGSFTFIVFPCIDCAGG